MSDRLILGYHTVSDSWAVEFAVTTGGLERQLRTLLARGYRSATLADAASTDSAERLFVVTFDDAHRVLINRALPLLARLGVVATVFVVTDYSASGAPMSWILEDPTAEGAPDSELSPLNWNELRRLQSEGWEVGSHTATHPRLSQLRPEDAYNELVRSKRAIEDALGACRSLSFPYSAADAAVFELACRAGYRYACTSARVQYPKRGIGLAQVE